MAKKPLARGSRRRAGQSVKPCGSAVVIVGEALRSLRLSRGLSREGLARRTGLSMSTILRIESGAVDASREETAELLSMALGVEMNSIVAQVVEA